MSMKPLLLNNNNMKGIQKIDKEFKAELLKTFSELGFVEENGKCLSFYDDDNIIKCRIFYSKIEINKYHNNIVGNRIQFWVNNARRQYYGDLHSADDISGMKREIINKHPMIKAYYRKTQISKI